jgi:hypothetical protein
MYAQLTERGIEPRYREAGKQLRHELIVTSLEDQPGYCGIVLTTNFAGEALLLTLWETEDALNKSRQPEIFDNIFVGSPIETVGEVIALDWVEGKPQVAQLTISPAGPIVRDEVVKLSRRIVQAARRSPGFVC